MPRCPNGTRKNKQGACVKYNKTKVKTPIKSTTPSITTQINQLTIDETYLYIAFIKDPHMFEQFLTTLSKMLVPTLSLQAYKKELLELMVTKKIIWDELMHNIYNSFFTSNGQKPDLGKYKYFIYFDEYPSMQLHCQEIPVTDKIELMNKTKEKYPNFHTFFTIIMKNNEYVKDRKLTRKELEKIREDINNLSDEEVCELILLQYHIAYYRQNKFPTDADFKKNKCNYSKKEFTLNKKELYRECKQENYTIQQLKNLRSLL